jgi:hypothetical protein
LFGLSVHPNIFAVHKSPPTKELVDTLTLVYQHRYKERC